MTSSPEPTARDRAFDAYWARMRGLVSAPSRATAMDIFKAGWAARKQLDYELVTGIRRSPPSYLLHSSAYESLTPFIPPES
jgi:hypothetical protein